MLYRHELPIAEYDDDPVDLLSPMIPGEFSDEVCPAVLVVSLIGLTSYHYLPPGRWVELDPEPGRLLGAAIEASHGTWLPAATWTTDAILRETPAMVDYRRDEGCDTVEMECASMAAVCRFRGAEFGQLLFTADTLADGIHDARNWGGEARDRHLDVCVAAAVSMAKSIED